MTRRAVGMGCVAAALCVAWTNSHGQTPAGPPRFELVQPETFAASGGQPNCWADFDNDGDLDLFVGFREGVANHLYRNDSGTFTDVAAELGVADLNDTRAASWGDFDGDGDLDVFIANQNGDLNGLFRNDGARLSTSPRS